MNDAALYARLSQSVHSFCHLQRPTLDEGVESCSRFFGLDKFGIVLLQTLGALHLLRLLSLVILESKRYLISHIKGCVSALRHIISILSLGVMIDLPILIGLKFASLWKRHSFDTCSRKCTRRSSLAEFLTNAFEVEIGALVVYFII